MLAAGAACVHRNAREPKLAGGIINAGSDLLSHTVSHAVPSAVSGLTSVFGMGTGVTPPLWPPETWLFFVVLPGAKRPGGPCEPSIASTNIGLFSKPSAD